MGRVYAQHTPGTLNHLVDRFISNRLESIYADYTSASKDWYQKTTVVGHNILNNYVSGLTQGTSMAVIPITLPSLSASI